MPDITHKKLNGKNIIGYFILLLFLIGNSTFLYPNLSIAHTYYYAPHSVVHPKCSDGIDNDNDGKIDFYEDKGCSSFLDDDENDYADENIEYGNIIKKECEDAKDNDLDGKIDINDSACHTDGKVLNNASYNKNIDDENSKPTITLLGNTVATTTEGDTYKDVGATAFDEEDGDLTSKIVLGGDIMSTTTLAGNYKLIFSVADSKGALASTTRYVIVNQKQQNSASAGNNSSGNVGDSGSSNSNNSSGGNSGNNSITGNSSGNTAGGGGGGSGGSGTTTGISAGNGPPGFSGFPISFINSNSNTVLETPLVLGAKTEKKKNASVYKCNYLFDYLKFGEKNDSMEVMKLQLFLKNFEGFKNISATGKFDRKTLKAVRGFQTKYKKDILEPWALPSSTGYVYITTKKKVNEIYCGKKFALTLKQKKEISEFRALMKRQAALEKSENLAKTKGKIENSFKDTGKINQDERKTEAPDKNDSSVTYSTSTLTALTGSVDIQKSLLSVKENKNRIFNKIMPYLSRYKLIIFIIFIIVSVLLIYLFLARKNKSASEM